MTKYGFLGIGIMGKAMATNLLNAGFDVTVWNRTAAACRPLMELGAKHGKTAAEVVAHCDITFAVVSDPEAAKALCFGKDGVLEGISEGKSYIDISTVDADTSSDIYHAIKAKGGGGFLRRLSPEAKNRQRTAPWFFFAPETNPFIGCR